MSLRHKDDWDEADEQAYEKAIKEGKISRKVPFVPGPDYDYGKVFTVEPHYLRDADFMADWLKAK